VSHNFINIYLVTIVAIGGAIANAVFDATGARLYRLPLTPERVLAALH